MKKTIILSAVIAALAFSGCGSTGGGSSQNAVEKYGSDTLKFYNWGEYIGENVISDFEEEYGVKVISEYFDSNEMMYTKLQSGDSYDVIVPSDYMIERLIKEDMLQKLDLSLIPNMENLADGVKNLATTMYLRRKLRKRATAYLKIQSITAGYICMIPREIRLWWLSSRWAIQ